MSDRLLSLVVDSRSPADRAPTGTAFRELDRVRTLAEVIGEDGERVPAGSTGTIVAVWGAGAAFDVEFTRPVEALAAIAPESLVLVERAGA
ncbi:DUF4926 domain-containing protein [Methylobacterium brachiatum]|uniref:DUF4926 domain-containing protein n=1 Tax=Methylobacterium brachiatum TaxID=269660 RepID=A0ABV1R3A1_9HYPH|nr:DUF4926 domain-containing protein [Methylobacterium brachiatum]CAA2156736.1 hypothetical protein MBRA_02169 [Methylobacterium brachiatum]SFI44959.1 hypothetical protein SAMN02799642_01925 [Methylobacterium brachiatum]